MERRTTDINILGECRTLWGKREQAIVA